MGEKRLKDKIKEVRKQLREKRRLYGELALSPVSNSIDLDALERLSSEIQDLEHHYQRLYNQYLKKEDA